MYRIKFIRLCRVHRKRIVEHGPWQPSIGAVETWIGYFSSLNYPVKLEIECLEHGRTRSLRSIQL